MEGHWKLLGAGGGRVFKAKMLEAKYEDKLEFPVGRGEGEKERPSMGGVCLGYFLALHICRVNFAKEWSFYLVVEKL